MTRPTLLVATTNPGKLVEIGRYLEDFTLKSLKDFSNVPTVAETGKTFSENALIKAKAYADFSKETVLADDSGLAVEALGGAPGIYSARYAGENATDSENRLKLLAEMRNVPTGKRQAAFVCVLTLYDPKTDRALVFEGRVDGEILCEEKGTNGFGYDSLFYVPDLGRTTAELSLEEKNRISHRGQALDKLSLFLSESGF